MRTTLVTLTLCMFGTSAAAQYTGEPPQVVGGTQNIGPVAGLFADIRSAMAANIGVGVQNIQQYEMRPWTGQNPPATPGLFYLAFTHANGAWTGLWDSNAPAGAQFTPLNDFQNLDQSGLFSLSVSRDHLVCVCDRGLNSWAGYSVRSSVTQPWTHWESLGRGFGYVDSKVDQMNGSDQFFWVSGKSVYRTALDRTAFNNSAKKPCTGTNYRAIANPTGGGGLHSHDTLVDAVDEVRAMTVSINDASGTADADPAFASTPYGIDPIRIIYDSADWHANPGNMGGTTYWSHNPNYTDPDQIDLFASNGAVLPSAATTLTLRAFIPFESSGNTWFTQFFIGMPSPVSINLNLPGIYGNWGLAPGTFAPLPPMFAFRADGGVDHVFPIPPLPPGFTFATQCLGVDQVTQNIYLGNTATVLVQ